MVHATIMASRRRSISAFGVVTDAPDETVHRFGILNGDDFQHLSNFNIELIQEVLAGEESGFLCQVVIHKPMDITSEPYSGYNNIIIVVRLNLILHCILNI